jgi:hypothetical protein
LGPTGPKNVDGRVHIRVGQMAARQTSELGLTVPILGGDVPA